MLYVVRNRDTGEIFESESLKVVFRVSISSALGDFRYTGDCCGRFSYLLELSRCDDCVYWMDERGYLHSEYVNESRIALIAVSGAGYVVDMDDGRYLEVDRGCN